MNLNDIAGQEQVAELLARESKDKEDRGSVAAADERGDQRDLRFAAGDEPAEPERPAVDPSGVAAGEAQFYKVAAPVLTNYVYDQATLTND